MTKVLTPTKSAELAEVVYESTDMLLSDSGRLKDILRGTPYSFGKLDDVSGRAGGFMQYFPCGFGFMTRAKSKNSNTALLVLRGTDTKSDVVTDSCIGFGAYGGSSVGHPGIQALFNTMKPLIDNYLKRSRSEGYPIGHINVVGHSLGGALATMAADWLKSEKGCHPSLYTFGAPKPGGREYAKRLTLNIGTENIYRVAHRSDPVTLVPMMPYMHAPLPGNSYLIGSNEPPGPHYHSMLNSYLRAMKGKEWSTMYAGDESEYVMSTDDLGRWLYAECNGPISWSFLGRIKNIMTRLFLGVAMRTKGGRAVSIGMQHAVLQPVTSIDQLCTKIRDVAMSDPGAHSAVARMLAKIATAAGMTVMVPTKITEQFVWKIFMRLWESIRNGAIQAMHMLSA